MNIALGYFDGVHLGHKAVLEQADSVFTFENPARLPAITDSETKHKLLKTRGIKQIHSYNFGAVRNLTPEAFVHDILIGELKAETVTCGYNFRFGRDARASAEDFTALGIEAVIIPPVEIDGIPVSSTRIKELIISGSIAAANRLLGYELYYEREVIGGNKLGRTIGFPTINQTFPSGCVVPRFGVYRSRAKVHGEVYAGITNIGVKPTAELRSAPLIETHIINYDGDLYGEKIKVSLIDFIRPERKFNSFEELKQQIEKDLNYG